MSILSNIVSFPGYVIDTAVEICGCSSPQKSSGITRSEDSGDGRHSKDPIETKDKIETSDEKVRSWLRNTAPRQTAPEKKSQYKLSQI